MDEIGARFYLMHYQDLHNIFYRAATSAGIHISFSTPVIQVEVHPPGVRLAAGEVIRADLIVGADGADGITREVVERCRVEDTIGEMSFVQRFRESSSKRIPNLTLLRAQSAGDHSALYG